MSHAVGGLSGLAADLLLLKRVDELDGGQEADAALIVRSPCSQVLARSDPLVVVLFAIRPSRGGAAISRRPIRSKLKRTTVSLPYHPSRPAFAGKPRATGAQAGEQLNPG